MTKPYDDDLPNDMPDDNFTHEVVDQPGSEEDISVLSDYAGSDAFYSDIESLSQDVEAAANPLSLLKGSDDQTKNGDQVSPKGRAVSKAKERAGREVRERFADRLKKPSSPNKPGTPGGSANPATTKPGMPRAQLPSRAQGPGIGKPPGAGKPPGLPGAATPKPPISGPPALPPAGGAPALAGSGGAGATSSALATTTGRAAAATAATGGKATAAAALNPWVWVAVGVVVVLALLVVGGIGVAQLVGRNENALCGDPSGGGGSSGVGGVGGQQVTGMKSYALPPNAEENGFKNAEQIANWLVSTPFKVMGNKPFTPEQAAAVIGNFYQESKWDPFAVQSAYYAKPAETVMAAWPNEKALSACGPGGRALGILQMDGLRCKEVVQLAMERGVHWSDLNVQMEFFRQEFDDERPGLGGYFKPGNKNYKGFQEAGKTVREYTIIFNCAYERSGDCTQEYFHAGRWQLIRPDIPMHIKHQRQNNRIRAAEAFLAKWTPGRLASSAPEHCGQKTVAVGSGEIADLARQLAFPTVQQSRTIIPKPEYRDAKIKAMAEHGRDGMAGLYASCDRFAATVIKLAADPKFPWGETGEQFRYASTSPLWEEIPKGQPVLPGDVFIKPKGVYGSFGHIAIAVSPPQGSRIEVAHASFGKRVGGVGLVDYHNHPHYKIFRFKGGS